MRARAIRGVLLLPAATIAVAVAALSGCGGGHSSRTTDGPLSSGNSIHDPANHHAICAPGGHSWTFGLDEFTNYGHNTVVLDRLVLIHPRNQRLLGAYAVPGERVVGNVYWPPHYAGMPPGWKDRQPVPGFRLAPGKSFNLVLGLAAMTAGRRAISNGELVYYHDSSGSYVANSNSENVIAAGPSTKNCLE